MSHRKMDDPTTRLIFIGLTLLLLACTPFNRLQELNRKGRVLATGVAIIGEGDYLALAAYQKLEQLPGYRLESRSIIRDEAGHASTLVIVSQNDARGNRHVVSKMADGQQQEQYIVAGQTYYFKPEYSGWVREDTPAPAGTQPAPGHSLATLGQSGSVIRLLPQLGAVPTKAGHEIIQNRAATRYELEYVTAELAETFGQQVDVSAKLYGTLWVDNQTGALLKSEIFLYEDDSRQPRQEFYLEASQIGHIAPIVAPTPLVNPDAVVAATATAQAWSVLPVELEYKGQPIAFDLIPVQISQVTTTTAVTAEMELSLRQLPASLPLETEIDQFLSDFGSRLSLSIPRQNLVVTSHSYRIIHVDLKQRTITVSYRFQADLDDFSHVELILASPGNPIFAPVPVAAAE